MLPAQDLHHRPPLHSDTSRQIDKPSKGRIASRAINHLGDEVMKVFKVRGIRAGPIRWQRVVFVRPRRLPS